jgi:hypothetical protein
VSARAALLALWAALLPPPAFAVYAFGLFGDLPYSRAERARLPALLAQMDAAPLEFVVHVGDLKSGAALCSDAVYRDRLELFNASRHPLVFVPGDNDWTDCARWSNGRYDPLERLARLRAWFYPDDMTLGQRRLRLQRQSEAPRFAAWRENARWQLGPVLFLTLNVPGGNNNIGPVGKTPPEFARRMQANTAWLEAGFDLAGRLGLAGIVVFIHGNPGFEAAGTGFPDRGYAHLIERLAARALAFPGQVLLVHGDTHRHNVGQPLRDPRTGARIRNFTRVETYGSPFLGWVEVTVDDKDRRLFRIEPRPHSY